MEAHEWLKQYKDDRWEVTDDSNSTLTSFLINHPSSELDEKVVRLLNEFDEFINDDFNTAKVLANMFELVPVINSIKDKQIAADALLGNWRDPLAAPELAHFGDEFVQGGKHCVLITPSALAPAENNWLINPAHPDYSRITVHQLEPLIYDPRMFHKR